MAEPTEILCPDCGAVEPEYLCGSCHKFFCGPNGCKNTPEAQHHPGEYRPRLRKDDRKTV